MQNEQKRGSGTTALCGFRGCRAPLPPPGPRGGRPFEFCPDREWSGGRTCKQLAAADQALRDAMGESLSTAELRTTVDEFLRAASALGEPLQTVRTSLAGFSGRVKDEVAATAARAEEAEARAVEADGRRQAAEARAEQAAEEIQRHEEARRAAEARAGEAARLADARVEEARRQIAEAESRVEEARKQAEDARKEAEVVQAGAEAGRVAAERQAENATKEARRERERADRVQTALAERSERLSVRTTERDALRDALGNLRTSAAENERRLQVQLDQEQVRLEKLDEHLRSALQEHRGNLADAARELGEARDQAAALTAKLAEAEHREHAYADLQQKLVLVQRLALDQDQDPQQLRRRLLAELLSLTVENGP
ncbi:MAG TPA: response regulator receiver protein [Amycolatopsis sp.]|nr:response regulator receiver protein [Amycolatopsis sp.]